VKNFWLPPVSLEEVLTTPMAVFIVSVFILWHVDPLLGNDREMSISTATVAK
jgi:hypothetical protein